MADGMERADTNAWHPGFCSATEYDLRAVKERLTFECEHSLSKEPLKMDLLIIMKNTDEVIDNDIARIFRKYNVIEYKSPDDALTIDDFSKTLAYAWLYKATAEKTNEIPASELTVSLFREGYPHKLAELLEEDGAVIRRAAPGVYEVQNAKYYFPIQIIATGELDPVKHAGLRILSKKAKPEDIEIFLNQAKIETSQGERQNIESILTVSISANKRIYEELKRRNCDMSEAIRDLMRDEINEALQKGEAKGRAEGRAEGEAKGRAEGEAKGRAEGEAKGRAEGEAKGEMKGMLKTLAGLVQSGLLSIAAAAVTAKMSEAEFTIKMNEALAGA